MTAPDLGITDEAVTAAAQVLDRSGRWDSHSRCDDLCTSRAMALDIVRDALSAAVPLLRKAWEQELRSER